MTQIMDRFGCTGDICRMTTDISLADESAGDEVEPTFEERVVDVASDYETLLAECVVDLGLPP